MSDLPLRLRQYAAGQAIEHATSPTAHVAWEAAKEIERLRARINIATGMIDNCADVPTNPDSLPQMVKEALKPEPEPTDG